MVPRPCALDVRAHSFTEIDMKTGSADVGSGRGRGGWRAANKNMHVKRQAGVATRRIGWVKQVTHHD